MSKKKLARVARRRCACCRHQCDRLHDAYWCYKKMGFVRMDDVCGKFIAGKARASRGKRPAGFKPNEVWDD